MSEKTGLIGDRLRRKSANRRPKGHETDQRKENRQLEGLDLLRTSRHTRDRYASRYYDGPDDPNVEKHGKRGRLPEIERTR